MNSMEENNERKEELLEGTQEKKVEVVKVGRRIAEAGVIKVTSYEENMTSEGVLERITTVEFGQPDCDHIGVEIGGQCLCGLWWCRDCASKQGSCIVCGRLCCPTCGEATVLDKNRKYHKSCWSESVKRKILG